MSLMCRWRCVAITLLSVVVYAFPSCEERAEKSEKHFLDGFHHLRKAFASLDMAFNSRPSIGKCVKKPVDCADWYEMGYKDNREYTIWPMNRLMMKKSLLAYCDMRTDGGGWTVIQRRGNYGKHDWYFYKDWLSYKNGFGDVKKDFWLGNDNIFALTNQRDYSVRFDLEDDEKNKAYAKYQHFWINDELNKYMVHLFNFSGGSAGDAMSYHNSMKFSTRDQDNDLNIRGNCALKYNGAWWYNDCYKVNLNGVYNSRFHRMQYQTWKLQPVYWSTIKIKPIS